MSGENKTKTFPLPDFWYDGIRYIRFDEHERVVKLLKKVIDAKDNVLVAYRTGGRPSEKSLDILAKYKKGGEYE